MFKNFRGLKQEVNDNMGVLTVSMASLRDAYGVDRLGKIVIENISKELAGEGLKHYPTPLPLYQHLNARIYVHGSRVEEIIESVLANTEDANEMLLGDEILRESATGEDTQLLNKVRKLVCR